MEITTKEVSNHTEKSWEPGEGYTAEVHCVSDNGYVHVRVSGLDGDFRFELTGIAPPRVANLMADAPRLWWENRQLKAEISKLTSNGEHINGSQTNESEK